MTCRRWRRDRCRCESRRSSIDLTMLLVMLTTARQPVISGRPRRKRASQRPAIVDMPGTGAPGPLDVELRKYWGVRSPKAMRLLLWLIDRPDRLHSCTEIGNQFNVSAGMVKVLIWQIRVGFRESGRPDPIENSHGRGYRVTEQCMPGLREDIERMRRRLRHDLRSA